MDGLANLIFLFRVVMVHSQWSNWDMMKNIWRPCCDISKCDLANPPRKKIPPKMVVKSKGDCSPESSGLWTIIVLLMRPYSSGNLPRNQSLRYTKIDRVVVKGVDINSLEVDLEGWKFVDLQNVVNGESGENLDMFSAWWRYAGFFSKKRTIFYVLLPKL